MNNTHLPFRAATGIADITPPLEVGLLMSSVERRWAPFEGVRLPLHARALVVEAGSRRIALVSLELLGLSDEAMEGMPSFRRQIMEASGHLIKPSDMVLVSTHTHSSPETMALSDLHRTPAFRSWARALASNIGAAIVQAVQLLRPCSLHTAITTAPDLGIHRRIKTTQGILLSHPAPPAELVLSRSGAVDASVHVAAFMDEHRRPAGIVVNAACHPVHEMCHPQISPDYPGIMSSALERQFPGAHVLFLNGADGNVNPPTVSGGALAAEKHGLRLAELVDQALGKARPAAEDGLDLAWQPVSLPARAVDGRPAASVETRLAGLRLAEAAFLFIPGEPFAETGLAIREHSPFPITFVSGYAEGSIGYIPTDEAFSEGGYETGPGAWSRLAPGSEAAIRRSAIDVLQKLHGAGGKKGERADSTSVSRLTP